MKYNINVPFAVIGGSQAYDLLQRGSIRGERIGEIKTPFGHSQPVYHIRNSDIEMLFLKLKRYITKAESPAAAQSPAQQDKGVAGSLAEIGFADLIQMVTSSAKTMTIVLTGKDRKGEVVVVNGEVFHAACGDVEGENAFYELMRWTEGSFETRRSADAAKRTIQIPVMSLLMEGARLADEQAAKSGA